MVVILLSQNGKFSKKIPKFAQNLMTNHSMMIMFLIMTLLLLFLDYSHNGFECDSSESLTPHVEASILLISAFLTFLAFRVQYQYNNRQKNDLDNERRENNIYHFIDKLDDISRDFKIDNVGANKVAFHFAFYELHALYYVFYAFFEKTVKGKDNQLFIELTDPDNLMPVCVSFVLSGVTQTSNRQIHKRIVEHVKPNEDTGTGSIRLFQYYSPYDANSEFRKLERIVLSLQHLGENDLRLFKKENRLILFIDYADSVLSEKNKRIVWFGGRRSALIRYIKYLHMIVTYIDASYQSDIEKNVFYDSIFSIMSEHEVGVIYALSQSKNEFYKILGVDAQQGDMEIICQIEKWMRRTNEMYDFRAEQFNQFKSVKMTGTEKDIYKRVCERILVFSEAKEHEPI